MRLTYLDCLKGFLILLVVWGHVVQNMTGDFFSTISFRTIYSFHMAAFFFISGIVLQLGRHDIGSLLGKIQRLLVPYLSWYVLCVVFCHQLPFLKALAFAFSSNSVGLWFLFTLAECIAACIISEAVVPERHHRIWLVVVGLLMIGLAMIGQNPYFNVRHFAKFYQYFLGGYLLASCREWIALPQCVIGKWDRHLIVLALAVFLVGVAVASVTKFGGVKFQIYKVAISWAGCISLIALFRIMSSGRMIADVLSVLGKMTLGIYATHIFLLLLCGRYVRSWPLPTVFMVLFALSTLIVLVIRRVPLLSIALLGK